MKKCIIIRVTTRSRVASSLLVGYVVQCNRIDVTPTNFMGASDNPVDNSLSLNKNNYSRLDGVIYHLMIILDSGDRAMVLSNTICWSLNEKRRFSAVGCVVCMKLKRAANKCHQSYFESLLKSFCVPMISEHKHAC